MSRLKFFIITTIIISLYFEIFNTQLFLRTLDGLWIRMWVPPLILFLVTVANILIYEKRLFKPNYINLSLLLYAFFGLITVFIHNPIGIALKHYLILIAPVWCYVIVVCNYKSNKDIELAIKIMMAFILLLALYTLNMQGGGANTESLSSIKTSINHEVGVIEAFYDEAGAVYSRGIYQYENSKYCILVAPLIILSLSYIFGSRLNIRLILILCVSAIVFYTILLTQSRAGIIASLGGIIVIIYKSYMHIKEKRKAIIIFSMVISVLCIYYIIWYEMQMVKRIVSVLDLIDLGFVDQFIPQYLRNEYGKIHLDSHISSLKISLLECLKSPIYGHGLEYTNVVTGEHNRYLNMFVSYGAMTFTPYIIFLLFSLKIVHQGVQLEKRMNNKRLRYTNALYACVVMYLLKLNNEQGEAYYYWIMLGFSAAWVRNMYYEHNNKKMIL